MDPFNTRDLDSDIEDARTKKKTVDMKMDSIMSLMREVELREKAAQKAKQEVDDCTLEIMAEINELTLEQQRLKETNDKRAQQVYARKAKLATEMNAVLNCLSGVLSQGDACLATIDKMNKSLEKRLTSAIKQKEAADKEKWQKEATLAYERSQMKKLVEESKKLEQQAMENIKLQELITNRGLVVNMLQIDLSYKCQDVNWLNFELGDYQERSEISNTEDCIGPFIPGMLKRQNCESYKIVNSWANYPEFIPEIAMDRLDEDTHARNEPAFARGYQKSQMEKLVEESKAQEQEKAIDNSKEFLTAENVVSVVTEDYSMPMTQETIAMQDCGNKCYLKKGVKERIVASGNEAKKNKIIKSRMINSKTKDMKKWILGQITEAVADHEDISFA